MKTREHTRAPWPPIVVAVSWILVGRAAGQGQAEFAPASRPADPAAEALAGWDDTMGLWFPPLAPRETYLQGSDPNRNLIRDIQAAFSANAGLRTAVCALVADPKREVRTSALELPIRQRRTMLQMLCAGAENAAATKKRAEEVWHENEARWEKARDPDGARSRSAVERRSRFFELESAAPPADSMARLDRGFERLGLMPQAEMAVFDVLNESPFRHTPSEARFQDYLRRVFERESSEGMPEVARYLMGHRNYLFFTNRLAEARAVARSVASSEAVASWRTDNLAVLALMERLFGDPDALKRLAPVCRPPESEARSYEGRPEGAYCWDLVVGLASRSVVLNAEKAPAAIVGVLEEAISAEPANWWRRADACGYAARVDPARGRRMAEDLLGIPATLVPLGVRLAALATYATASEALHDAPRAVAGFDRYLDQLRYRPSSAPANLWARLTALPEREAGPGTPFERTGWLSISWALGEKATTLIESGDPASARRAIEEFLSNALNLALMGDADSSEKRLTELVDLKGLSPSERESLAAYLEESVETVQRVSRDHARWTRYYLQRYGVSALGAGRRDEAIRVAKYLIAQPGGEHNLPTELAVPFYAAREKGEPLSPAATPWGSAAVTRPASVRPTR